MRVLVFQHTAGEHPACFTSLIAEAGDSAHTVRLWEGDDIPDLAAFDAMLVMGGPMDVWEENAHPWLRPEKAAIAEWVGAGRAYLGVCLGHQLLVEAMGGRCAKMVIPEIGVSPVGLTKEGRADGLLAGLPDPLRVMQWHGVEAETLPEGTTLLASNPACHAQAIRVGNRAWGVQFHPEIDEGLVGYWMGDPGNRAAAIEWLGSAKAADQFASDSAAHVPLAAQQSAALYARLRGAV
ncbi:type 1 glutamine amidotransferase [Roseovarius sp. LXJ103]|uniref:type 1 glutamine amidotransferase n=1 Tax=Roseovarius carneus TaxID=2853164 RepID=UPI000D611E7D|nr:type 1 glutamine amidotransferase [Roseovarius carneus]MBZ8118062.1 type 1 glutamine amidotransferase [Roseovarius carneus]PWE36193.1 GMP synthase [Pelagicola sp. LXJ1103]